MDPYKLGKLPNKSLWHERPTDSWSFYCPLCKSPRKIPYRPKPGGFRQVSQVVLTTAFLTLLMWSWLSWKGIVVGLPLWIGFEVFYRARVRVSLACPYCGFDPFLYLSDVKRARTEIEGHWRKVFADKGIPFPEKNPLPHPGTPIGQTLEGASDLEQVEAEEKIPDESGVVS